MFAVSVVSPVPPCPTATVFNDADRIFPPASVNVVGPLPAELQSPDLVYMAGSPAICEQPLAAKAFIDFLAGPSAKPIYKAKGMEPG